MDLSNYQKNLYQNRSYDHAHGFGEDGVILKIFETIGISGFPFCVEFGEDDILGTTTRSYRIKFNSRSLYFNKEISLKKKIKNIFSVIKLCYMEKTLKYLNFFINFPVIIFASEINIVNILKKKPLIDLLSIDIDSNDFFLVKKILKANISPKVFIVEYNPNFPNNKYYAVSAKISEKTNFQYKNSKIYGANLNAYKKLFKLYNYKLVYITGYLNLIFIDNSITNNFKVPKIKKFNSITKIKNFNKKFSYIKSYLPSWANEPNLTKKDYFRFKLNKI
jgi:hypothetical protein